MDYTKQNFKDGQVLGAEHLNHIEDGILALLSAIKVLQESNSGNEGTGGTGGNVDFKTDNTLTLKDGILSVNTTDSVEQDNTLPITSAGVFATVGNIESLLKTI